jgi:hypothetical protein
MKLIVGIIHLIATEDCLQTTLIERLVVCNKWKTVYQRLYLRPNFRKYWCFFGIFSA